MPSEVSNPFSAVLERLTPEHDEAIRAREAEAEQRQSAREQSARVNGLMQSLGRRYAACTLDNYQCDRREQSAAVEALKRFAGEFPAAIDRGDGLVLYGPSGTGKDHLAAALLKLAVKSGKSALAIKGVELFGRVRDAIQENKSEHSLLVELLRPDVLLISDPVLDFAERTRFNLETLYRVVDGRYEAMKSTWVTLNVKEQGDAAAKLGNPIRDRLLDGSLVLFCNWPSYREGRRK